MQKPRKEIFTALKLATYSPAPLTAGGNIRSGTSFDQLLAQTYEALDKGS